jgi:hypothetical protein
MEILLSRITHESIYENTSTPKTIDFNQNHLINSKKTADMVEMKCRFATQS